MRYFNIAAIISVLMTSVVFSQTNPSNNVATFRDQATKKAFESLLSDSRGLELSTGPNSVSTHFTFKVQYASAAKDNGNLSKLIVARKGDYAASAVSDGNNNCISLRSNGLLLAIDTSNPNAIAVERDLAMVFRFTTTPDPKISKLDLEVGDQSPGDKPEIIFDPIRILKSIARLAEISFDGKNILVLRTVHSRLTLNLAPPEAAYPLLGMSIASDLGYFIGISDFHIDCNPAVKMFEVSERRMDELGIAYRVVGKDTMKTYTDNADDIEAAIVKAGGSPLQKILLPDIEAYKQTRLDDLILELEFIKHWPTVQNGEDDASVALLRQAEVAFEVAVPENQYMTMGPQASAQLYEKACIMLGKLNVGKIQNNLLDIVKNTEQADLVRLMAADLLCNIGTNDAQNLLTQITVAMRPSMNKEFGVCLATIRNRLNLPDEHDDELLAREFADASNISPLRARCLQSLCAMNKFPVKYAKDALALATDPKANAWSQETALPTLTAIASCSAGRNALIDDLGSEKPQIDRSESYDAIYYNIKPSEEGYSKFLTTSVALINAEPNNVGLRSQVFNFFMHGDSASLEAGKQYVKLQLQKADGLDGYVAAFVIQTHCSLDFADQLKQRYTASSDPVIRKQILNISLRGVPEGGDGAIFEPILKAALHDSSNSLKMAALDDLSASMRLHQVKESDFRDEVAAAVKTASGSRELRISLFALHVLSQGKFDLDGAPMNSETGWPLENAKADQWWTERGENLRSSAVAFIQHSS